jgi:hypothetical protein
MAYTVGGLIEASDYNGFVNNTAGANLNSVWAVGTGDRGWGQTTVPTVAVGDVVTATTWATLVNTLATACNQTNTSFTSRTAPVTGNLITILPAVNTDLTNLTNNRGNAAVSGTEYGVFSGSVSKTTPTGAGGASWTITFTHTIQFADANSARYFWNAGGLVRIQYGKSSNTTDHDADWNTLAGWCGSIFISGRVNSAAQLIAGTSYTGTTRIGGTGGTETTLATTTGWYNLTPGAGATTMFQLNSTTSPYTPEFIRTQAQVNGSGTQLILTTTWFDDGTGVPGATSNISGGTDTPSPATTITGTAPTTLVTYRPPATSFLSNTWGVPTISASVA